VNRDRCKPKECEIKEKVYCVRLGCVGGHNPLSKADDVKAKISNRELLRPGVPLSREEGNIHGWPGAWNNLINQSVSDRLKSTGGFAIARMVLFTPTSHLVPARRFAYSNGPGSVPNPLTDGPGQVYLRPRSRRESAKKAKSFIRQWQSENGGLRQGIIMRNQEKSGYDEKSPRIAFENSWTRNK